MSEFKLTVFIRDDTPHMCVAQESAYSTVSFDLTKEQSEKIEAKLSDCYVKEYQNKKCRANISMSVVEPK